MIEVLPPETVHERWSSPDAQIALRLVRALGPEGAHRAVDALVARLSNVELAALAGHWPMWARSKQIASADDWVTWGKLEARGTGKTTSYAAYITQEVQAGRAKSIGLAAQNYVKTVEVQVGALIRAAPPWFKPTWIDSREQLHWPNGAIAFARTPEVPGAIRSENHELAWLSEVQSWPAATRDEAWMNFAFCTRIGYARTLWDATPKRGHPILKKLLAMSAADPRKHVVGRGTIYENPHIARAALEKLEAEYAGTSQGDEELLGKMRDETENALVAQAYIDKKRRQMPDVLARRLISVDPAITARAGSDRTGLVDVGLGIDAQMLVFGDHSGKHTPAVWGGKVLDLYVRGDCDCVIVETNRGGDLVTQNLRAHAGNRGLRVVVIGKDETPRRMPGVVNVKEVHARGAKEDRAKPLATAYERGRVSHIVGADLSALEDTLTTWEPTPGQKSPDPLDALSQAATELLGLLDNRPDGRAAFVGLTEASRALSAPSRAASLSVGRLGGGRGGTI